MVVPGTSDDDDDDLRSREGGHNGSHPAIIFFETG